MAGARANGMGGAIMNLYEFITPSDPITFYAPDNDIAEAIAIFVGNGKAGCDGPDKSDMPNTMVAFGWSDGQLERFQETMDKRLDEVLAAGKTFAVVGPGMRQEYDTLTQNSTDEKGVELWDGRHRSSISDWCGYARNLKLKKVEPVEEPTP